ncbi:hypothetical protein I302_105390 [Kwoniella bestiolae CBS 10118]|uniref:Uncharacterized protein n=1 Tax=Kwoniella bestiolae CBS 10118 TaxID=1296100 RepID=A0A1B9FT01_9TREE|nr:hypothetical protein I302_08671 [Kwoniella bestiolae CBS 10118]OCF21892.1 hypothetical protein I302_08671 [Kwoniella bestiolae CBS 10118]
MPSSTLPTYYLPPPHAAHLSRSVPSSKPRPPRATLLDNLLTDLITTSDLNTSRDEVPIPPSRVKSKYLGVAVDNDLHLLKHSISERNVSDSRRSAQDLNLVEKLMEDHKRELKELEKIKYQLKVEKEENAKLRRENERMKEDHARKMDDLREANKRALKILMGLQRDEFICWSRGLKPYLREIDQAVRNRIDNWEKNVRSNGYHEAYHQSKQLRKPLEPLTPEVVEMERRRSSSPEGDLNMGVSGRKSPSKARRDRTIRRTRRISGLELGQNAEERDRHPFARC